MTIMITTTPNAKPVCDAARAVQTASIHNGFDIGCDNKTAGRKVSRMVQPFTGKIKAKYNA